MKPDTTPIDALKKIRDDAQTFKRVYHEDQKCADCFRWLEKIASDALGQAGII